MSDTIFIQLTLELAQGNRMPKVKRPRSGPPMVPTILIAAYKERHTLITVFWLSVVTLRHTEIRKNSKSKLDYRQHRSATALEKT